MKAAQRHEPLGYSRSFSGWTVTVVGALSVPAADRGAVTTAAGKSGLSVARSLAQSGNLTGPRFDLAAREGDGQRTRRSLAYYARAISGAPADAAPNLYHSLGPSGTTMPEARAAAQVTCMGDKDGMHTVGIDRCVKMSKGGFVQLVCRDHIQYWAHQGWQPVSDTR